VVNGLAACARSSGGDTPRRCSHPAAVSPAPQPTLPRSGRPQCSSLPPRRGAAQLESARAETAALRALANAGKLLDAHPALAQLRLVQQIPCGSRVVLAMGGAVPDTAPDPD